MDTFGIVAIGAGAAVVIYGFWQHERGGSSGEKSLHEIARKPDGTYAQIGVEKGQEPVLGPVEQTRVERALRHG